jgi:hypothetical protein
MSHFVISIIVLRERAYLSLGDLSLEGEPTCDNTAIRYRMVVMHGAGLPDRLLAALRSV